MRDSHVTANIQGELTYPSLLGMALLATPC